MLDEKYYFKEFDRDTFVIGKIFAIDDLLTKEEAIQQYLSNNEIIERYIVVDDDLLSIPQPFFVRVRSEEGLNLEAKELIIKILNRCSNEK